MPPTDVVRVFVSYSHDSLDHKRRTLALAERLRDEGIDCDIDQFHEAPPEGWLRWMESQVRQSDYVLVVCTAVYHRRVTGREREGIGLGAVWEAGLITQELYESGGRNERFIPVVFNLDDVREIPPFLRQTTYYNVEDPPEYESLYRRLTAQPRVVKRPLGQRRRLDVDPPPELPAEDGYTNRRHDDGQALAIEPRLPPSTDSGTRDQSPGLALLRESSGRTHFIPLLSVTVRDQIEAVIRPGTSEDRIYLESLVSGKYHWPTIDFAFGLSAMRTRLASATRVFEGGMDRYTLILAPEQGGQGGIMEMATSGLSADDIATLRARRILLNETLPSATSSPHGPEGGSMLEHLIRGLHSPIDVDRSPLPDLYRSGGRASSAHFVQAAKLVSVLWLRLSGTVANVLDLDLCLEPAGVLRVYFRGERARIYDNKEPEVIEVAGACKIE